jgi:hypothetical protein
MVRNSKQENQKDPLRTRSKMIRAMPTRNGWVRNWQYWAPYAAVAWSLMYAGLGLYWIVSGRGFPFASRLTADGLGPIAGRFRSVVAWIIVILEGFPALVVGEAMLRGVRSKALRSLLIIAGALLSGILLLLMTGLDLLVKVGYIPAAIFGLLTTEKFQAYLSAWTQWAAIHQLLCLIGGFLWLAATVSYARRSGDACMYCGRTDAEEGCTTAKQAAHWGRIAVYVAMVAPIFYAFTRIIWALGIPLGMTEEAYNRGQEIGSWIGGLSLAALNLVGAALMLGLVQRWGEVFPRWMIGLAGRRVPIALAVVPAALASVLLTVGGIGIWSGLPQMVVNLRTGGSEGIGMIWELIIQVGPTLLFPVWGVTLALASLGYYYRRRGPCKVCGR